MVVHRPGRNGGGGERGEEEGRLTQLVTWDQIFHPLSNGGRHGEATLDLEEERKKGKQLYYGEETMPPSFL